MSRFIRTQYKIAFDRGALLRRFHLKETTVDAFELAVTVMFPVQGSSASLLDFGKGQFRDDGHFITTLIDLAKLSNTLFVFVLDDTAKHNLNELLLAAEGKGEDCPLTSAHTSKHNNLQISNIKLIRASVRNILSSTLLSGKTDCQRFLDLMNWCNRQESRTSTWQACG
jgi:hypothetical protein